MGRGQAAMGAIIITAGLATGLTAIFMDMLWGAQSLALVSAGIALMLIGFAAPLFNEQAGL